MPHKYLPCSEPIQSVPFCTNRRRKCTVWPKSFMVLKIYHNKNVFGWIITLICPLLPLPLKYLLFRILTYFLEKQWFLKLRYGWSDISFLVNSIKCSYVKQQIFHLNFLLCFGLYLNVKLDQSLVKCLHRTSGILHFIHLVLLFLNQTWQTIVYRCKLFVFCCAVL